MDSEVIAGTDHPPRFRVWNPFTLLQWSLLFQMAAVGSAVQAILGLITLGWVRLSLGSSGLSAAAIHLSGPILPGVRFLVLLSVAQLLRHLFEDRERPGLGRRLGGLLWFLAVMELALGLVGLITLVSSITGPGTRALPSVGVLVAYPAVGLARAALYATAGWIAGKMVPMLIQSRHQAMPADAQFGFAVRACLSAARKRARLVSRFLSLLAVPVLPILAVVVVTEVARLLQSSAGSGFSLFQLFLRGSDLVNWCLVPGLVLCALAVWTKSLAGGRGWRRGAQALPLILGLTTALSVGLTLTRWPSYGGVGGLIKGVLSLSWSVALLGAACLLTHFNLAAEEAANPAEPFPGHD